MVDLDSVRSEVYVDVLVGRIGRSAAELSPKMCFQVFSISKFLFFPKFHQTVVVQEGDDKLVQTQYGDKEVKIIREFTDTHLKTVSWRWIWPVSLRTFLASTFLSQICIVGDVTSTRIYKRT